ncbi:MAG: outer membrane lipoprotein carrier protein LolA [Bacteroidales bacterium]|nr:outer membrane lipoprotein carrier protein LolA [Bacteroidales bacterium]
MKRTVALLIAFILGFQLSAQITHTDKGSVDQTANTILKKAAAKMSGTVSFTVTVVNLDADKKESFRQKVDILYNAPRYRVKTSDLEIYCNGKAVWQLNKPNKEVVITPMTDSDDDITNPARLLNNYSKSFRAKFIREESDGTAIVDLQPMKARSYHKIRLYINAKTGLLKKMEQHNFDSSRGVYTLSNFKNTKATDSDFTYNIKANPGVEVVDMR